MAQVPNKNNRLFEIFAAAPTRIAVSLIVPVVTFLVLRWSFIFMRDSEASKFLIGIVALTIGVGGVWVLFAATNNLVSMLPTRMRDTLRPFVFVGPAVAVLLFYIVFPALRTIYLSFLNRTSTEFVGLRNYEFVFTDPQMLIILRNTLLWVLIVPFVAVAMGLLIAVMTDRLRPGWEKIVKSLIFLPMAISFVGASVIWRFVYYYQPAGYEQIGLLNAIVTAFGGEPVAWLIIRPWNNFFLLFIMIWLQTGFAMVIQSAAVKGVPSSLLEAARIDGANEIRIFFNVIIPYIKGTILTVMTTILFMVLKIFDIVYVMTSGNYDTGIVASRMYKEAFIYRNFGRGSALAVFLFIVVIPFMIRNITQMRENRR
ncbi:MAG: sugar ABC transporter permease [Spirochaetaceae bacterium]|nr:sugar ABC transporter permease [Spirochaetaceae bacterium]MCF7951430.1 sugar ABC transporter permease [Spirochaetaceae bacterium]